MAAVGPAAHPELSLVIPFYNEHFFVEPVTTGHVRVLDGAGVDFEIILVNNGSTDSTGDVCRTLAGVHSSVRAVEVEVNRGYGYGIRQGLAACQGRWLAYTDGDDQIPPEAVLRVFEATRDAGHPLGKAVREQRYDSRERRLVSAVYNRVFALLHGEVIPDVNAKPKIIHRSLYERLGVRSDDWFIDAEIMLRCRRLSRTEVPITFRERSTGTSHVRLGTLVEFARNMLGGRFRISAVKDGDDSVAIRRTDQG